MDKKTQTIQISGVTCDACVRLIAKLFAKVAGVSQVLSVDKSGLARVLVANKLSPESYQEALNGTDYSVVEVN